MSSSLLLFIFFFTVYDEPKTICATDCSARGYSGMVSSQANRQKFLENLSDFIKKHDLDGVDYNWEYPSSKTDWRGFAQLLKETKAKLGERTVTMAYYPDTRQEKIISILGLSKYVDLFHSMSYDKVPGKHSTLALAKQTVSNWEAESLPKTRLCLGIPFYARHIETGDAKTYEEIHRNYHPLSPKKNGVGKYYFNGVKMIAHKTKYAVREGLGGMMIWELGQDIAPTSKESLLVAISSVVNPKAAQDASNLGTDDGGNDDSHNVVAADNNQDEL